MEELFAFVFELIYSFASLAWSVLPIIGMWLVFEKAGDKGWKSVIPFYNMYTMLKLGDKKQYWTTYLIGVIIYIIAFMFVFAYLMWGLFAIILALGAIDAGWAELESLLPVAAGAGFVALVGYVMALVATIHGYAGICKKMGQGAGMVIGLIFLGPIFWMLLGVSKQYQWEKPAVPEYQAPAYTPAEYQAPEWHEPFSQADGAQKGDSNTWTT